MTAKPGAATPRLEQIIRYLHDKYPDPLTDDNRLAYYMEASELYSLEAQALQLELATERAARAAAEGEVEKLRKQVKQMQRDAREDAMGAATEARWRERQGEDYGSY